MTAQKKRILKIAIVMVLIVGAPILYFLSIGGNPLAGESSGTKQIAIVNEDAGAKKQASALDFGKEVLPILSTESAYKWSVVSRNTAEKGLANREYDAILYIPTNFSENIMTYEEQQPEKAEFKYTVSGQLNTANREKVLREIDNAASRVNGKISTLYWSYVSQDLEKVREEFDSILQKEMEFLETISDVYRPDLETIVGDIESQKRMIENLSLSINSVPVEGNVEQAEQFQENLGQFVAYVNQYQEYQTTQQQLLQTLQGENITAVMDVQNGYGSHYTSMKTYLEEQNEQLTKDVQALEKQLAVNHEGVTNLSELAIAQRDEIIHLLKQIEGEKLVQSELEVIDLRNKLAESAPLLDPTTQASLGGDLGLLQLIETEETESEGGTETEGDTEFEGVPETEVEPGFETDPETKGGPGSETDPETEGEPGSEEEPKTDDESESDGDSKPETDSKPKPADDVYIDVLTPEEYNQLYKWEIELKETEILNLSTLNDGKKERLTKLFNEPVSSDDNELLDNYYAALAQYGSELMISSSSEQPNQELASSVNKILGIYEEGNPYFHQLQGGVPTSQRQFATVEEGIQTFFTEYLETLDTEYKAISNQLNTVESSAGQVQNQLNMLLAGVPGTSKTVLDGNTLVTNHQSISQSLQIMSDSLNNIAQNQQSIMSVTAEIHTKAANVNADTSELAFKWNENVGTTEKYRDDIHSVLNNAFIDGQKNGEIYDHLSTPLSANSLDPTIQENKMPPVIVLVIVLISSLLIGYFCYYFKNNKPSLQITLFSLLNLIVGLIISIFGMDIYGLGGTGAIEWTIFTVLLLTAVSSIIFAGFSLGQLIGWFVNVGLITFFVTPMLTLLSSNINYEDPMSKVYLSIQYGPKSLIIPASIVLVVIIGIALAAPYFVDRIKNRTRPLDEEATYEA